jgi:serine/threonine protein kinase/Tfp pilus assembly protein PilF
MIGKTILHYKIIEKLGEGGMGIVYKAEDTKLKRDVAIKFLPSRIADNKEERERFKIEAQAAAALNHPNIATIHAIEEHNKDTFIVMEYIDGQELKDIVGAHRKPPIPIDDVIKYATQIAEGLQAAHEKGIIHRDIKSSNIMITSKNQVKIMDFGLAKVRGGTLVTKAGTTLGTAAYMSPEQARGNEADHRSDIWSFGVVIYEMLTGQLPFSGDYEAAVAYSILNEEPATASTLNSEVPLELERIVTKTLAKDPNDRYQRMDELPVDLKTLKRSIDSQGQTKSTMTEGIPPQTGKKNRLMIYSILAGIIIILLASLYFFIRSKENPADSKSIAVLPFKNLSEDKSNEFFSDGITEDIIAQLSKISDLRVISRTSVMAYKNSTKSLREIGNELDVATILEGSVRRADNQIRIVAQLIDAKTDEHLWAETYDKEMTQIFAIQSDVAQRIGTALKAKLSPEEKERIEKAPTDNLEAYSYYLRGREHYSRYEREDNEKAIELFNKAREIDPNYSLAYAGIGDAYGQRANKFGFSRDWLDSAIVISEKAISLDPNVADGYKALGLAFELKGWYKKALEQNQKAIKINPNNDAAVANMGWVNLFLGNLDEALKWSNKSLRLNPTSAFQYYGVGIMYINLDDFEKAEQNFKTAQEIQPELPSLYIGFSQLYLTYGKYDKAVEMNEKMLSAFPEELSFLSNAAAAAVFAGNLQTAQKYYEKLLRLYPSPITFFIPELYLGYVYSKSGDQKSADRTLQKVIEMCQNYISERNEHWKIHYDIAAAYAIKGNKPEAYRWLQNSIDVGFRLFRFAEHDPVFENLHDDPEFKQMMEEVKKMVYEKRAKVEKSETS